MAITALFKNKQRRVSDNRSGWLLKNESNSWIAFSASFPIG
jgi:hypothetical protein